MEPAKELTGTLLLIVDLVYRTRYALPYLMLQCSSEAVRGARVSMRYPRHPLYRAQAFTVSAK